nr:Chain B, Palmitoyl H3K9 Peptide [synthetic construct]
QTARKSTGGW